MPEKKKLTELEGGVLALIRLRGPCTPYAIRKEFLASSTPYWSGSAGAIYPLFRRLRQRRLIRTSRSTGDGRNGRLYTLTAAGTRALDIWLRPPLSPSVIGSPPDPIRTRVGFFGILSSRSRQAFVREARLSLQAQLKNLAAELKASPFDPFDHLAQRGRYLAMKARLAWVNEVAAELRD
jgi:DNA-binding PadR family transcriptional regulator